MVQIRCFGETQKQDNTFSGIWFIHEDDVDSITEGLQVQICYPDEPTKLAKLVAAMEFGRQEWINNPEWSFETYLKTEVNYHLIQ